ncbi:unnamed protein product [Lepeophtheirus salmonis]|uniref:(salmon louse) hypothetical protein n=1 Tax=Lepeophtheirus salmonis TaxID=72036 RepID=A0A7R8GYL8_LEPSM|nr:unnamed protein product [Lepeophtheirus salmonis]CAF2749331.1 unnamed protein product [Lepeophtheirus salmonis]
MEVKSGSNNANLTSASGNVGLSSRFVLSDNVSNDGNGGSSSGQENKQGANSHLRIYAPRKASGSDRLLDTPSGIPTSTSSNTRNSSNSEPTQIEDIRRRLEKIKQSAFLINC